ncbi:hypothetical protein [Luteimonas notoginsengisoli]|uniref:Uncharacterized protein n=1 Tax=Luteimonas notoginsengisoli TaxID=1578200 RepID=A0ABV7URT7_9GAMM
MGEFRRHAPATFARPPGVASMRGLQAAMAALYAPPEEREPAADLAECEQRRRECDDRQRRQGELRLG